MRSVVLALALFAAAAAAQQPTTAAHPDSARAESSLAPTAGPSLPPVASPTPAAPMLPPAIPAAGAAGAPQSPAPLPPQPTPAQLRFQQGLRTVGRGVAQLRDGLTRVENTGHDSVRVTQAKRRLGGLCGTARLFLQSGRGRLDRGAYEDSPRLWAELLIAQIDTLLRIAPVCETNATRDPGSVAAALEVGLMEYDTALRDFRLALSTPPPDPPAPPPK
ncbi:MAG TPA: hypothetical protein VN848_02695 [Gemmatimonadales bacterium]|nr:hypothetical protein [Gemmatimonadales bacterium]